MFVKTVQKIFYNLEISVMLKEVPSKTLKIQKTRKRERQKRREPEENRVREE